RGFAHRKGKVRLNVEGIKEVDYDLRPVRLSSYRRPLPEMADDERPPRLRVGPGRAVALNVAGPARVTITTTTDCVLRVTDGLHLGRGAKSFSIFATGGEEAQVDLRDVPLRTVAFEADKPCAWTMRSEQGAATA